MTPKENLECLYNAFCGLIALTLTGMFFHAAICKEIRLYDESVKKLEKIQIEDTRSVVVSAR
ncbi:hypothetical protein EVB79_004 [Rhizobium phage RHph_N3_13]|nr:hypothetical protein EVB79_004 [Rhizobium phage RHph_N3_13]QIG69831.1 hypothetical protein F67_I3_11_005 [Rhizobium phage RHph_I3_11]